MPLFCLFGRHVFSAYLGTTVAKRRYTAAAIALAMLLMVTLLGCTTEGYDTLGIDPSFRCGDKTKMAERDLALSSSEKAAWHKSNLYDSATDSFYLPPELFYASRWDGTKCLTTPPVDYHSGYDFCDRIVGPVYWEHPGTKKSLKVYLHYSSSGADYFHLTPNGFEKVYRSADHRLFEGALHYPAGPNWHVNTPVSSTMTVWEGELREEHSQTMEITEILFDREGVLAWVVFQRWEDGVPKWEIMLEPKRGVTRVYDFDASDDAADLAEFDCGHRDEWFLHDYGLSDEERASWNRANIRDDADDSYFIPVELWTGGVWSGEWTMKMNPADLYFGSFYCKHTSGPTQWLHPYTLDDYPIYTRTNGSKEQYFTVNAGGVGRLFDNRDGGRYFENEVKFPAGPGWRIGERARLPFTQWHNDEVSRKERQVEITRIVFDENDTLAAMTYRWFVGDTLDHEYTYMPKRGMTDTHKFSED